jgi:hypothetical protein
MFDYVISLREGIMDAWGGIIGAMKTSGKSKLTLGLLLWQLTTDGILLVQPRISSPTSNPFSSFLTRLPET